MKKKGKKREISIYLPADFRLCFLPLLYDADRFKIRAPIFAFCVYLFPCGCHILKYYPAGFSVPQNYFPAGSFLLCSVRVVDGGSRPLAGGRVLSASGCCSLLRSA
jgi:hypothetical protein